MLTVQENQTTEEAWLGNTGLSENLRGFLDILGHRIELKGYTGYAAGLDTKSKKIVDQLLYLLTHFFVGEDSRRVW